MGVGVRSHKIMKTAIWTVDFIYVPQETIWWRVSTWHLEPTCLSSLQLLTHAVFSFPNFPEHMLSPSNLIFYLKTSEHSRPQQTFFFLDNGPYLFFWKKCAHASCHLLDYYFGLLLNSCLVILSSMCVHMSHFPNHSEQSPRAKTFLMFLQNPPPQWLAPRHTHSMALCVWIRHGGSAKCTCQNWGKIKLPHDWVSKGVESWRDINNNHNSVF